jgi:PAS domain S-box-containing protein
MLLSGLLLTCAAGRAPGRAPTCRTGPAREAKSVRACFSRLIPHPAFVFDIETLEFLEVNEAAVEQYGFSREEFLRMKVTDIRAPEEKERCRGHVRPSWPADGRAGQWKHVSKDGRVIPVEVHLPQSLTTTVTSSGLRSRRT